MNGWAPNRKLCAVGEGSVVGGSVSDTQYQYHIRGGGGGGGVSVTQYHYHIKGGGRASVAHYQYHIGGGGG